MADFKICYFCKEEKHVTEFHRRAASPDGIAGICASCKKSRGVISKYGRDIYSELFEQQNGLCALCGKPEWAVGFGRNPNRAARPDRLSIDHDHDTGEVRGLLCRKCNANLAIIENDPEWVERALSYINPIVWEEEGDSDG